MCFVCVWLVVHDIIISYHIILTDQLKDLKGQWCMLSWTERLARGKRIYFPLMECRQSIMSQTPSKGQGDLLSSNQWCQRPKHVILSQRLWPTRHGELNSRRRTFNDTNFFNQNCSQIRLLTFSSVYSARSLKTLHLHIMHHVITGFPHTSFLICLLFISVKMALE